MTEVIIAAAIVGGVGILIGVFLGLSGEKLKVEVDEKEVAVREALPGNNCGGCGFPGCDGLAAAIVKGEASVDGCPVGGNPVAQAIAQIMGVTVEEGAKKSAIVKCTGDCEKAKEQYTYTGVKDCYMASLANSGGPKACSYGCLGMGSCVKVCENDAIHIINGIAVIDPEKCVSCGQCVKACPKGLIEIRPVKATAHVMCSSKDKGKAVMDVCSVGCIGCTLCEKQCEYGAIVMENNIPIIDAKKCIGCGKCAEKCPKKIIKIS